MIPTSNLALLTTSCLVTAISAADGDWFSNWSVPRTLEGQIEDGFDVDPNDDRATMRGSGQITIGNGIAAFNGSPRLYIAKEDGVEGWENIEFTAFGRYVDQGTLPYKSYSGLTLATRSNHDLYTSSPCDAFGYYAKVDQASGECSFLKEYYHSRDAGNVYTRAKYVPCFEGGLPLGQWIGMKFKVTTDPGTSDVLLELYLDENDDGNWALKHTVIDTPGYWLAKSSNGVPSECPQKNGDTILRPGNASFLRTDGVDESTEVHWRDVSIMNTLSPSDPTCDNGMLAPSGGICCDTACGSCGGPGCASRPGGDTNCCEGTITSSNVFCTWSEAPCIMTSPSTPEPSKKPTLEPSTKPTPDPSKKPTPEPSKKPTLEPSKKPTPEPSKTPTPEPSKKPTPEPSKKPTPEPFRPSNPSADPTPKPPCDNGILAPSGDICCDIACGSCGGPECASRPGGSTNCCEGTIAFSNVFCTWSEAPCIMTPLSTRNPTPEPSKKTTSEPFQPSCNNGILAPSGDICCDSACGSCGGPGCASRPGGSTNCCEGTIAFSNMFCVSSEAPCIMTSPSTPDPTPEPSKKPTSEPFRQSNPSADPTPELSCNNGILAPSGDICCDIACGSCGGPGCASRPGGSTNCCEGTIAFSNAFCASSEAPCIMTFPSRRSAI